MVACEEPQVRLDNHGVGTLSDTELLALMLTPGSGPTEAMGLAQRIIREAGSITALAAWHRQDYQRWAGIGSPVGHRDRDRPPNA